jgi:hypothetical protein
VDFALFNIPRIAKSDACRQRAQSTEVAEPIRRCMARILTSKKKKKRVDQLKALRFLMEEMCRLLSLPRELSFLFSATA